MALTINTQPTSPKFSYGDIVYSVQSNLVGPTIAVDDLKLQYSTVIDIYQGATRLNRFRKQPNPVGVTVFNLSDALNDHLEYDLPAVGSTLNYPGIEAAKTFSIRFGEEYLDGVGDDEAVKIFNGSDVEGDPATTANDLTVYKGFDAADTKDLTDASTLPAVLSSSVLFQGARIHRDDLVSISTLESGVVVHNKVTVPSTGASLSATLGGTTFNMSIYDEKSFLEETRFAWFNRTGGIDWFTVDQEGSSNTSVSKDTYTGTNIDYGVTTPTTKAGNTWRPSETVYGVDFNTTHSKNTRWLTEQEADALQGLFDSPVVYVQNGSTMRPVIITNSYEQYVPKRSQPLFQYSIEYRYTNDKISY